MATIAALTENFEGGSSGSNITTGNSFFTLVAGANPPQFLTESLEGTRCMVPSVSSIAVNEVDFTAVTTLWLSFYLKITALPAATTAICQMYGDSRTNKILDVRLQSTGVLQLRSNDVSRFTSTALATDVWHRIAVGVTVDSTCQMKIYSGANLHTTTTSQDSGSQSNTNTIATNCDNVRLGVMTTDTTIMFRMDRVRGDDAAEPAPHSAGSSVSGVAAAAFGGTYTASGKPNTLGQALVLFGGDTFTAAGDLKILGVAAKAFGGSFTASGVTNLSVPTGLTAQWVTPTRIDLTWNAVGSAAGYDIERNGVVVKFDQLTNSYSDTGLTPQTSYSYRVRSVG